MNDSWKVLPEKFLLRLNEIIPNDQIEKTLSSFCERKPSTFRANTIKISPKELVEKLKQLDIKVEPVSWNENAFILENVPQRTLTETELYKQGYFYVQSLSSMIPPLVLDAKSGDKVLDLCAAPGSKTTQIATMMQNTGEILANDKSHVRNYKLKANLSLQGVTNTQISQYPGEILWKKFPEYFDKTLVDVPCSMEGRFFTQDEKTYRDWSINKVRELSSIQKFLLRSAISATKPGGTVVYSTCTLSPEENEEVVEWILKKEGNAIEIEKIEIENLSLSQGLTSYKEKVLNSKIKKTVRIYPTNLMEGFFVAKIKKNISTITNPQLLLQ